MSIIILGLLACTTASTIGLVIKDIITTNALQRLRAENIRLRAGAMRDSMRRHPANQNLKETL